MQQSSSHDVMVQVSRMWLVSLSSQWIQVEETSRFLPVVLWWEHGVILQRVLICFPSAKPALAFEVLPYRITVTHNDKTSLHMDLNCAGTNQERCWLPQKVRGLGCPVSENGGTFSANQGWMDQTIEPGWATLVRLAGWVNFSAWVVEPPVGWETWWMSGLSASWCNQSFEKPVEEVNCHIHPEITAFPGFGKTNHASPALWLHVWCMLIGLIYYNLWGYFQNIKLLYSTLSNTILKAIRVTLVKDVLSKLYFYGFKN